MTKPDTLDCLVVKNRAQRPLAKVLATRSPEEQAKLLRRLAARLPLWNSLEKTPARQASKRGRSTG